MSTNDPIVVVLRGAIEEAVWTRGDSGTPRLVVYTGLTEKWSLTLACDATTQDGVAVSRERGLLVHLTPELAKMAREKAGSDG